jgi:hypothetical protein
MHRFVRTTLAVGGATLLVGSTALAGQFKRLDASTLAPGTQVSALASPQNQGAAMEMDAYEYLSAAASYRCRITFNSTGEALNLRVIGVNGTVAFSCTTPVNGTCDTPFVAHAGNLLFQCLVATGNGSPVTASSAYVFAVQRQPAALEGENAEDVEIDRPSGLASARR